jgi:hypothetical protein
MILPCLHTQKRKDILQIGPKAFLHPLDKHTQTPMLSRQVWLRLLRCLERRLPGSGLERGPGCHPERLVVILSEAKDLSARRARPFASLRVTGIISKYLQIAIRCLEREYSHPSEASLLNFSMVVNHVVQTYRTEGKETVTCSSLAQSFSHSPWRCS